MRVSVIITTYNNPIALKKVLDSLLIQIKAPNEIIVADDGSGDDTAQMVKSFSTVAPFPVFHVWQEDKGFRAARVRNEAIKQSSWDYIVLLDGDCVVNRHFISDHLSLSEKGCFIQGKRVHISRDAVAGFDHEHANSTLILIKMAMTGKVSNIHHLVRLPCHFYIKNKNLSGIKSCNMSFLKRDILAVNGFSEDFVGWGNEDSELACRFFKYGIAKKVNPFMAICFHLWHPTNKSIHNTNKELLLAALASKEYFCKNGIFKKN